MRIQHALFECCGVKLAEAQTKSRANRLAIARHGLSYFLWRRYRLSTVEIGRLLNRDHSTICHSLGLAEASVEGHKSPKCQAIAALIRNLNDAEDTALSHHNRPKEEAALLTGNR
ncbi:MAG: helix-turn-helix domain-containing protein [Pseudomonadota bacterium]